MTTRDILNYLGEKIGEMTLPDDTTEAVWAEKLAMYAAPPPSQPIVEITPRQIRTALVMSGVSLADIDTALDSLPEPVRSIALIEWEYSIGFARDYPMVSQVGQLLGWNDSQLDDLWRFAATL
jgi:hypothetical protein